MKKNTNNLLKTTFFFLHVYDKHSSNNFPTDTSRKKSDNLETPHEWGQSILIAQGDRLQLIDKPLLSHYGIY